MALEPEQVNKFAVQAIELGWAGSGGLPRPVASSVRAAALAIPLREPTQDDERSALSAIRVSAVVAPVILGGFILISLINTIRRPQENATGYVVLGILVLVTAGLIWRARRKWGSDGKEEWGRRQRKGLEKMATAEVALAARALIPSGPNPDTWFAPRPGFVDSRDAEYLAAEVMTKLGCREVQVTQATRDGGIDVLAIGWVTEVKHHAEPVAAAPLHRIYGVAQSRESRAMFFSLTGYRQEALTFGENTGMLLFSYIPSEGSIAAHSSAAEAALRDGLPQQAKP